jgi:predicted ATPase
VTSGAVELPQHHRRAKHQFHHEETEIETSPPNRGHGARAGRMRGVGICDSFASRGAVLTKLYIDGFRLWVDTTFTFNQGIPTVLIGPNGSGKSTVLEVLAFLSTMASEGLHAATYEARGGPDDFFRAGTDRIRLEAWLPNDPGLPTAPDGGPVRYEVRLVRSRAFVRVESESIEIYKRGIDERPLNVVERRGKQCKLLNVSTRATDETPIDDAGLSFQEIRQDRHYPTLRHVRDALSRLRVYTGFSSKPRWALDAQERTMSPRSSVVVRPQHALDPRGRGLINALYGLQQNDEQRWDYLLRQMSGEFPHFRGLYFPADPGGGKIGLEWVDARFSGRRLADQMSEGMWSFLSLLAALLPADPAELIAFDEPDAHLHPSALRRLVGLLEEASSRSTVVFTTHSSRILDELEEPERSLVICEPTDEGTTVRELDPEQARAWLDAYDGPSALRERGLLDGENRQ